MKIFDKKFCLFFLILFLVPREGFSVTPHEVATRAQSNFEAGKYTEAIQEWEELKGMGFVNGDLFNNIASAYWRLGKVGPARRYFLLARNLSPRDPLIRTNLRFIEDKIEKKPAEDGPWALIKRVPFYRLSLNFKESLFFSAAFSFVVSGFLFFGRWRKKTAFKTLGLFFLLPFVWSFLQLLSHLDRAYLTTRAVILTPKAGLLEAPVTSSNTLEEIPEGSLVNLQKVEGNFALVKTASGKEGWLEKGIIGEID